ncbi:MAG: hypothetical protein LIP02_01200, partial [Bacteroidales bacterium]|nr:hypothetical protein [Bacteroidales bacterium]
FAVFLFAEIDDAKLPITRHSPCAPSYEKDLHAEGHRCLHTPHHPRRNPKKRNKFLQNLWELLIKSINLQYCKQK